MEDADDDDGGKGGDSFMSPVTDRSYLLVEVDGKL
jgi:hypothetical protein